MSEEKNENTIFVSVASYRDILCYETIASLFENAKYPMNVFIGICEQNDETKIEENCFYNKDTEYYEKYKDNVRKITLSYKDAKGPTYARYLCSTLYNNEKYFFQIDSHSKLVKDWDIKCIEMVERIKLEKLSEKPVLSYYPRELSNYNDYTDNEKHSLPRICQAFFNERDMISFNGSEIIDSKNEFYLTNFIAGGMFFCESSFLNELPFDPDLPYLFVGEEILHSIRFYTNGWDIYTPTENIIFHAYTRADRPKIWTDNPYYSDMDAFEKVKYYLQMNDHDINRIKDENIKNNAHKYGLGNVRTLQNYYESCGIDIKNQTISKNHCGREIYVHKKNEPEQKPCNSIFTFVNILLFFILLSLFIYAIILAIDIFKE